MAAIRLNNAHSQNAAAKRSNAARRLNLKPFDGRIKKSTCGVKQKQRIAHACPPATVIKSTPQRSKGAKKRVRANMSKNSSIFHN